MNLTVTPQTKQELSTKVEELHKQLRELKDILQLNGHLLDLLEEKYKRLKEQQHEPTVD